MKLYIMDANDNEGSLDIEEWDYNEDFDNWHNDAVFLRLSDIELAALHDVVGRMYDHMRGTLGDM